MIRILTSMILIAGLISACVPIPGDIKIDKSEFDGSTMIHMEPAWVGNSLIKFGLFRSSKMYKNEVILKVLVNGIYRFANDDSLEIKIDGELLKPRLADGYTDYNHTSGQVFKGHYYAGSSWTLQQYVITKSDIKRMIEAKKVLVRIKFRNSFTDGNFSQGGMTTALNGFRSFILQLDNKSYY